MNIMCIYIYLYDVYVCMYMLCMCIYMTWYVSHHSWWFLYRWSLLNLETLKENHSNLESPNLLRICVTLLLPPSWVYGFGVFFNQHQSTIFSTPRYEFYPIACWNMKSLSYQTTIKKPSQQPLQETFILQVATLCRLTTDPDIPLSTSLYTFINLTTSDIHALSL